VKRDGGAVRRATVRRSRAGARCGEAANFYRWGFCHGVEMEERAYKEAVRLSVGPDRCAGLGTGVFGGTRPDGCRNYSITVFFITIRGRLDHANY
jgi:hypothetical protein